MVEFHHKINNLLWDMDHEFVTSKPPLDLPPEEVKPVRNRRERRAEAAKARRS